MLTKIWDSISNSELIVGLWQKAWTDPAFDRTYAYTFVNLGTTFDVRHSTFEIRTHQENQPLLNTTSPEIHISVQDTPAHQVSASDPQEIQA